MIDTVKLGEHLYYIRKREADKKREQELKIDYIYETCKLIREEIDMKNGVKKAL